jgi:hypothetical protein
VSTTFYIPIEALTVPGSVSIGPITLTPTENVLRQLSPADAELAANQVLYLADEYEIKTFACVDTEEKDEAFELATQAVDVLRVFQNVRYHDGPLGQFCVAGDIGNRALRYASFDGSTAGSGGTLRGEPFGWTMPSLEDWSNATTFLWAARAIGSARTTEAQRRAIVGIQLLSQAVAENRGTFKMVTLVTALEALLLEQQPYGQSLRLARHVAYFGCGNHSNDLCGRSRDTCPYLALDPGQSSSRRKLERLKQVSKQPPLYCAEWHRVVDWYENRSDVIHGGDLSTTYKSARLALYWALRNIVEPILTWLATEPVDPVPELIGEISSLPAPPDWERPLGVKL